MLQDIFTGFGIKKGLVLLFPLLANSTEGGMARDVVTTVAALLIVAGIGGTVPAVFMAYQNKDRQERFQQTVDERLGSIEDRVKSLEESMRDLRLKQWKREQTADGVDP